MTVRQYIEESILILTISPVVEHFKVIKRRETETDGYLRGRAVLTDETLLEISMYCQRIEGAVRLIGYRFHWQDKEAKLLKRWDNAKHHPELKTLPYHRHVGEDGKVKESVSMDLWKVLRILESEVEEA